MGRHLVGFVVVDAAGKPLPDKAGTPRVFTVLRSARIAAAKRGGRVEPAWVDE